MKSTYKKDFAWNLIAEGISACQSALILIFISAAMTIEDAGVFSIGYAVATIACVLAFYGVRNYQVSDVTNTYSFGSYAKSRLITTIVSLLFVCLYLGIQMGTGQYTVSKALAVIMVCLWKLDTSIEDVFYGMYQQRGRLSLGARTFAIRLLLSTVMFCVLTLTGLSLIAILVIVCVFSYGATFFCLRTTLPVIIRETGRVTLSMRDSAEGILLQCLPLAVSSVLGTYIGNAPKYSIDWYMDDSAQAIFGYILMPSFVILILSNSVYRPILPELGRIYAERDGRGFAGRIIRQLMMVLALGALIIAGGFVLGIPALSILYSRDLSPYKAEFMLLLVGGIFYALACFALAVLTVMRKQGTILGCYAVSAFICLLSGRFLISGFGFKGAVMQYDFCNMLLCFLLFALLYIVLAKELGTKAANN